mmetsp:Transcript_53611/g.127486  ORF Transcript_53611/g.127486 Transcript_53611/m.127486 type:complete len:231 (-) Transcript_53611:164-856(-)
MRRIKQLPNLRQTLDALLHDEEVIDSQEIRRGMRAHHVPRIPARYPGQPIHLLCQVASARRVIDRHLVVAGIRRQALQVQIPDHLDGEDASGAARQLGREGRAQRLHPRRVGPRRQPHEHVALRVQHVAPVERRAAVHLQHAHQRARRPGEGADRGGERRGLRAPGRRAGVGEEDRAPDGDRAVLDEAAVWELRVCRNLHHCVDATSQNLDVRGVFFLRLLERERRLLPR